MTVRAGGQRAAGRSGRPGQLGRLRGHAVAESCLAALHSGRRTEVPMPVLPLYRWSGPGEDERQAAVPYWKRAIQVTVDLGRARESGLHNLQQVRQYLARYGGVDA